VGWYEDAGFTGSAVTAIPAGSTGAKTFYAKWELAYDITYVLNGGTNAAGNPAAYTESKAVTLAAATRGGYNFAGWYDNPGFTGGAITGIPAGNTGPKTFYAQWTIAFYNQSITFTINDLIDPAGSAFADASFVLTKPDGTMTITISGSDNDTDAEWRVGLALIKTGSSVTLSAANLSPGTHALRVTAEYGGKRYSKEITFTVY
jgi:uncharacterized repeat protein (TIGR02543 family)